MRRETAGLWLRWSRRDLRRHWVLVGALALVIALGTGAFAGLGGTTAWRLASNDASYAALRMHDLRVQLPDGGFVAAGTLGTAALGIPDAASITAADERLVVPTQVDASTHGRTVLVPGEIVGMPPRATVDTLHVAAGRGLVPRHGAAADAVLESKFAGDHALPARGQVVISGGHILRYAGLGYTPEYFRVVGRAGSLLGETGFAVLFMPLASAQTVSGHAGMVNDLVVRLTPRADRRQVQAQLAAAVRPFGATVTNRNDDPVFHGLYADARNDQTIWNMFALLILLGAAVAAFNLVTRMIDAQRREIGVGMALGVSGRVLALRPLLVGVQIAVLGVVAGVGVGWLMGLAMSREMAVLLPMPIWLTPFQTGRFLEAAALGLAIPVAATVLPLRRVLRLQPVDALATGARATTGRLSRAAGLLRNVRLPGRSYATMPLRNVLRAPRRNALTALGVAAAITCLVAVLGLLDSFGATGRRSAAETERTTPDRLTVTLSSVFPQNAPPVQAVASTPGTARAVPSLQVATRISAHGHALDAITEVLDLGNPVWSPTISVGNAAKAADGIVLSEKAAADLHVRPGDVVVVRHPVRAAAGFRLARTRMTVTGLHPNPIRPFSYVDARQAGALGLAGLTNELTVVPGRGTTQDQLLRRLFDRPGVAAVEPTTGFAELVDYRLGQFTGILRVIEVATLLLALLIAFNSANLSAEERAREHATMFAFGLPEGVVTAMAVTENALIGLVGTAVGIGLGYLALDWIVSGFGTVMPDISVPTTLLAGTVATVLVLGVLVVALAPLLSIRKQHRMDIPATLRVVE